MIITTHTVDMTETSNTPFKTRKSQEGGVRSTVDVTNTLIIALLQVGNTHTIPILELKTTLSAR